MANKGVQGKIPCLFDTVVEDIATNKRPCQSYRVVASKTISKAALKSSVKREDATEKIDGTCCFITQTEGFFVTKFCLKFIKIIFLYNWYAISILTVDTNLKIIPYLNPLNHTLSKSIFCGFALYL